MKCWPSLAMFGKHLSMPGGDLFYYDSAANVVPPENAKPTLVLIHGLGDEADTWRHIFRPLAAVGYRVIAPDLPGFGRSNWKGRISINVHRNAVIRLITFVDAERPTVLVGSSLGAGIAELVAGSRPDLAKGLILIAGCFPFAKSANRKFFLLGLPFLGRKWYRRFRTNHEAAWKSLHSYYADLDSMDIADRDFLRERVAARVESSNQERGYLSTARSMSAFFMFGSQSVARKIKKFSGRILILCGEEDIIFPPEKAGLFRTLRPDAEFAVVVGAGHLPHQEKQEASVAKILRFLQG